MTLNINVCNQCEDFRDVLISIEPIALLGFLRCSTGNSMNAVILHEKLSMFQTLWGGLRPYVPPHMCAPSCVELFY
uniref:Uncharacterized protein n=1 Tax=Romanomermis culicivorax TaxID=13658 RepID=A0A915L2T0_ROMCU